MGSQQKAPLIAKVKAKAKRWLFEMLSEDPPGYAYENGIDIPTIEQIKAFTDVTTFSGLLGYESYDENEGLFYNADSVSFVIEASTATALSSNKFKVLDSLFSMPHSKNPTIQVTLIADPNVDDILDTWYHARTGNQQNKNYRIFEKLARRRVEYLRSLRWKSAFSDESFLVRDFKLFISYNLPLDVGMTYDDFTRTERDNLLRVREAYLGTLKTAGFNPQPVSPERFINVFDKILNPTEERRDPLYYDENVLLSEQIISKDTKFLTSRDGGSLITRDKNISVLPWSVRQFPQQWNGAANGELIGASMDNVLRLPCPFILTLNVEVPDQLSQEGYAKRKSARATQMVDSPIAKYVPQWKERKQDWEYVTRKMDQGSVLLKANFQIVLMTEKGTEDAAEQALKGVYKQQGWQLQKDRFCPIHGFLSALPMWLGRERNREVDTLGKYKPMLSWNAVNFAPWIGEYKGNGSPKFMFIGRRGQLCFMDNFENPKGNYNVSSAAASGAGKSFNSQEFVFTSLSAGGRGFIFDSGGSYKNICKMLDGTYIEFSKGNTICLNPFSNIQDFNEGLPMLKMLLIQMIMPNGGMDKVCEQFLESALQTVWSQTGRKSTVSMVADLLRSESDERARDLGRALYSYTKDGLFSQYFEGECNVNFDNDLVVLEMSDLDNQPDLQGVVLLILIFNITQAFYSSFHANRNQQKFCIIDEAWRLLANGNSGAGRFIEEGYRVARKFNACFVTITQKVGDYYNSEVSKAAYANSDWIWLLRQKPETLDEARDNGWLTCDGGRYEVFRSLTTTAGKYSELAVVGEGGVCCERLVIDPFMEKLYSTKAQEAEFITAKLKEGWAIDEAIEELLKRSAAR